MCANFNFFNLSIPDHLGHGRTAIGRGVPQQVLPGTQEGMILLMYRVVIGLGWVDFNLECPTIHLGNRKLQ